ncbi:MAG TPA: hypothetical protein VMV57_00670 [Terracidiphilus sp.]|nr:hypothetical protein [Terracidiphilus sp.]
MVTDAGAQAIAWRDRSARHLAIVEFSQAAMNTLTGEEAAVAQPCCGKELAAAWAGKKFKAEDGDKPEGTIEDKQ